MEINYKKVVLLLLTILLACSLSACNEKKYTVEDIRKMMEEDLSQKYGEEFIVDRIGTRTANKIKFYQARIYPKSIIGTPKEGDSYYYESASIDILPNGKLGPVSDGYGMVIACEKLEKYLKPKIKTLFGNRFLIKSDFKYKIKKDNGKLKWYIPDDFFNAFDNVKSDPEKYRFELQLYFYIFNRIDNEEEKEERRKEIFDFVQYLKEEGLFKYLELGVIFIDERVLAPSYQEYKDEIDYSETVKEKVQGETVYLPPMELRKEMSEVLQKEVDKMSEEELLASMREIRKSDLKEITEYDMQFAAIVYSLGMLEVKYPSSITEEDKKNKYDLLENIIIEKSRKYIYLN